MTNKKMLLSHQKQRLSDAIDEISTPIFSTLQFLDYQEIAKVKKNR
ncbi:hypothetical protein ABIB40_004011 [Pedobacter sp. UYP30]